LKIYNAQGQEVAVVLNEKLPAGEHTVRWDAGALPAGVYYYQLRAKGVEQVSAGKVVKY
jgi:flagellar hook assembly protein FlgD